MVSLQNETQQDNPNLNYVIGTIQADDFSSFELTLPRSTQPDFILLIHYKDDSGNPFTKTVPVNLDQISPLSSYQRSSGGCGFGGATTGATGVATRGGGGFG
ncbi:MAG: hypothetical protein V1862_11670 [Methanobacteriota archaeon]